MVHSNPKKKCGQERKNKMKNNESGRSMVEMPGVLAMLNVLSIGGIADGLYDPNKQNVNDIKNK